MTDKEKAEATILARGALGDDLGQSPFWKEFLATLDHIDAQKREQVTPRLTRQPEQGTY